MQEKQLRGMVAEVAAGTLPRREFIERMVALGVGAPLGAAMLSAAGIASAQPAPAYKPQKRGGGGTLRILFWQGSTLLNPHFANGTKDIEACAVFHETLVRVDSDGNVIAVLAAEVPSTTNGGLSADGKTVTWKLKRGVQWHDGQPFTADDVVFNWQYATDPATAAFTGGNFTNIKAVEKIDSHTVRVVYERAMPDWVRFSQTLLVARHVFAPFMGARSREAPANLKPVGTGPYRFLDFKPGDMLVGELNPSYHLPNRPYFDRIEIKGGGDATSAARAVLQSGEFDFAWNVLVEDEVLKRMEASGKGQVALSVGGGTEFIMVNATDPWTETEGERAHPKSRHPILSEPAVRQALRLLVDRKSIDEFAFGRLGVATANYLNNPARYNSTGVSMEFNPDKANALLDAAGWVRGADGVRAKGGRRLKLVYQTSINSLRQKVQAIVKQSCAKAGIEIEIKAVSATVFFSSDPGNPDTYGKFWADLQQLNFPRTLDPARFMETCVSWEAASKANKWLGLNQTRWSNAEYDRLWRGAETELDPVKRAAMFIRMNDLVCNDAQIIPLAARPSVNAMSNRLVAPRSAWDNLFCNLSDWYREA